MKINLGFLLGISLLFLPSVMAGHAECCCTIRLTAQLVQDILDAINIIRPTVTSIQIIVNEINENLATCCANLSSQIEHITVNVSVSGLDQVITVLDRIEGELLTCCANLSSQIEHITVNVSVSGLDQIITVIDRIEGELETCCAQLNSKLDNISTTISINDRLILSDIDACCALLNSKIDRIIINIQISSLDQVITHIDAVATCCDIVNSKIGMLNDPGTCLDSLIDVPAGINNLNLTIIQLLKTILLELRGCSPC